MNTSRLGDAEIELIIAANLTRGQIKMRFGVGEHAAQLARTQAMAVARERRRALPGPGPDAGKLRALAEEYLEERQAAGDPGRLGTDRTKLTLFLDWLDRHDNY